MNKCTSRCKEAGHVELADRKASDILNYSSEMPCVAVQGVDKIPFGIMCTVYLWALDLRREHSCNGGGVMVV